MRLTEFPAGPADTFSLLVDFLKQDQSGKGMPRAVARTKVAVPFCCVGAIEAYARSRSLKRTDPLLMMRDPSLKLRKHFFNINLGSINIPKLEW